MKTEEKNEKKTGGKTSHVVPVGIEALDDFLIGHAQSEKGGTGCTVILSESGAVGGVDVRGSSPATRETSLLDPLCKMDSVNAVVLSGGSAYGLDAASGVMKFLEERGIGYAVPTGVVPIVCGASIFDLNVGDPKVRPDSAMGYAACEAAVVRGSAAEGNVGAGTGASVGKYYGQARMMKSGLGVYAVSAGNILIGAVVAVNAVGDIYDLDTGEKIAGLLSASGDGFDRDTTQVMYEQIALSKDYFATNTTIGCVVTNARLSKAAANKISQLAHNGLARTIRPVHTSADGDAIFTLASGRYDANADALGTLASEVVGVAVNRAVRAAKPAYGLTAASDLQVLAT
ncbi:MAG: P1 family peptidase [Clostridiales Family XIII bacterium]|jgi:L-aminopeptidase/D-esterase-like protein|nr:P1 family peptidase [Clostridiales Family XIII bacterium]